jgi:hypothetical protein
VSRTSARPSAVGNSRIWANFLACLQALIAEVNGPFEKINYPGMCGDHRLSLNRKGQQSYC